MKSTKKKSGRAAAPAKPKEPSRSAVALAEVKNELDALTPAELATINVDIPQAVSVVLGTLPHLAELRPALKKALPHHPLDSFDRLETYALAAYHAHILSLPTESTPDHVATLLAEATPLREALLGDAEALARRGLLDAGVVAEIRSGQGNVDKANDLVALSALFSAHWQEVEGKTAATLEEAHRAGELGPLLLAALGGREVTGTLSPDAAADRRRRAYTLLARAYDQTRRALAYLRWEEEDAEDFAPSLYAGRGRRPAAADTATTEPTAATPAAAT